MEVVKINLNNPPSSEKVNVGLQWSLVVEEEKPGCLAKFFRKHNKVTRNLWLTIKDIDVPEDVVCNRDNLFSVLYNENIYGQSDFPLQVTLTDMKTPFQLLFHQAEIKDCKIRQDANPREYPIKYKVELSDENGNVVHSYEETIQLEFEPLGVKPNFRISLDNEDIQYESSMQKLKVGDLAAWLNEEFSFTPKQLAEIKLKLYKDGRELPGHISFADGESEKSIEIKEGKRNVEKLPLYVNFTDIPNPLKDIEDFTIEATIVFSPSYSPEVKETIVRQTHFTLLKDQQGTELKTYIQIGDEEPLALDTMHSAPSVSMRFVPRSRIMGVAKIYLDNIASDNSNPRAGLYIKNLTLGEDFPENIRIVGEDYGTIEHLVEFDGPGVDRMKGAEGLFIPNGKNAHTTVAVTLNPSGIVDVINAPNYDFRIKSILSFDYWEDRDGTGNLSMENKKTCKIPISWDLHLEPNPEWLCVDYGSSAIVCEYEGNIIDLKSRKRSVFSRADRKDKDDTYEEGTPFLSSDIVFHSTTASVEGESSSTLCSQQSLDSLPSYLDLSVCLSPTSGLVKREAARQLPCLKILVGNEFLPKKAEFMEFKYTRKDNNGNIQTVTAGEEMKRNEETSLMRISSIFKESYASLFRYFILPECKGKNVNRLVLTYPNTYTPAHLRVLESIARDSFPKVREGYLRFVGESDAVAAYYLQNWDSYNHGKNVAENETVLVYDMGAGTLDITLFRKKMTTDGKLEVSIIGKIGTGKAGNYLDYKLSQIIEESVENAISDKRVVSLERHVNNEMLRERLEIKEQVKNNIKPNLNEGKELKIIPYGNEEPIPFPSQRILGHGFFEDFLYDVTKKILKNLFDYIGEGDLKVNTVLISGRSCRLEMLRSSLKDAMEELGSPNVRMIDLGKDGKNKEKTVVVEGAYARASIFSSKESPVKILSRRLYASYGLIYSVLGGSYKYVELLDSTDLPLIADDTVLENYSGPNKVAENTASAGKIKLIQTYLSPEETERAYSQNDMEFISEMEEYDMSDLGGRNKLNVRLELDYKNKISLIVDGRKTIGSMPKGVDLGSEITKASIWPVTI